MHTPPSLGSAGAATAVMGSSRVHLRISFFACLADPSFDARFVFFLLFFSLFGCCWRVGEKREVPVFRDEHRFQAWTGRSL